MKIQIMMAVLAMGLMAGCATREEDRVMDESAGANTTPSLGTEFSELPAAVQDTIRAQRPNAKIDDIDKEMRTGRTVYEIQFAEPGLNPKLHIAEDGTLIQGE